MGIELSTLRIATRRSPLALIQANFVAARLRETDPTLDVELLEVATRGDIDQSASLAKSAGAKGQPGKRRVHRLPARCDSRLPRGPRGAQHEGCADRQPRGPCSEHLRTQGRPPRCPGGRSGLRYPGSCRPESGGQGCDGQHPASRNAQEPAARHRDRAREGQRRHSPQAPRRWSIRCVAVGLRRLGPPRIG